MKKGFTLAEVLITLAIIGVVAALTIPTVIAKFQQRELYTRFIVAYNTFNNVYMQFKVDGLIDIDRQGSAIMVNDILDKLKYTIKCEANDDTCYGGQDIEYKDLVGKRHGAEFYDVVPTYTLQNGTDFQIIGRSSGKYTFLSIVVDTNGIKKGPNVVGRDYFEFYFIPYQTFLSNFDETVYTSESRRDWAYNKGKLVIDNDKVNQNCDPSGNDDDIYGLMCGWKLLRDGKMDY